MDVQAFEQRREQAFYTDAQRSVQHEIQGLADISDKDKLDKSVKDFESAVKGKGFDPSKMETMIDPNPASISTDQSVRAKAGRATDAVLDAGGRINEAVSSAVTSGLGMIGIDDPRSGEFAGTVLGSQLPEDKLGLALSVPLLAGVRGARKGVKAGEAAAVAGQRFGRDTVPHSTAQLAGTIKSEDDLRNVVDAPAGKGKTYAILTDNNPAKQAQEGYQSGSLSQIIRKIGPYEMYTVRGFYGGMPEESIMLVSQKPSDNELLTKALRVAKAAGQESIATNEGILFTDGSLHPRTGPAIYGEEAKLQPGYSVVSAGDGTAELPFSTPVDWNKKGASAYRHDYTGVAFTDQRHLNVEPGQYFLGQKPKELSYKNVSRYENELKIKGIEVYDFQDNPLNLPQSGYEQALKDAGYRAAITYGADGMPSLQTLDYHPVSRTIDRPRPFYGDQVGVAPSGAARVVYPEAVPDRVVASIANGTIDKNGRKELVQIGASMLAQPEMSSARPTASPFNVALKKGEKKDFRTRLGRDFKFTGADDLSHEDLQDALAYLSAEHKPDDPGVKQAWGSLISQVEKQFDEIGIKVEHVSGQPYKNAKEMVEDFKKTGTLKISTDFNEHPMFTPEQNLKFRAVHDFYGHIKPDHEFSMRGESGAFKSHVDSIEGEGAKNALRTEVLGQAASMLASGGKFPKQKMFDLAAAKRELGLVEGASADLFGSWMKSFEERLPAEAKGKLSLEEYRDLFNDSVKAYTKHLKNSQNSIPSTESLLRALENPEGRKYREWYVGAYSELQREFGDDADKMAKLLALFSPKTSVDDNVNRAFKAYRAIKLGETDTPQIMRAAGIETPELWPAVEHNLTRLMRGEELSGRKVSNFYLGIKGDPNVVVVDSWMRKVFGTDKAVSSTGKPLTMTDDEYSFIEDQIRLLARETGDTPANVQANLWVSHRVVQSLEPGELFKDTIRRYGMENQDILAPGHGLDEAGVSRLMATWMLAKVLSGAAIGGTQGEDTGAHIQNAMIGAGLGFIANKSLLTKLNQLVRENSPMKWFRPAEEAPTQHSRPLTPEEAMQRADAEAVKEARIKELRNKPHQVTVGEQTYDLDMKALDTPEQVKQAVDEMARVYKAQMESGSMKPGSRGVIPNALAKRLGEHLGLTEEDILNRARGSVGTVEHVFAYADVMDAAKSRAMQSLGLYSSGFKNYEAELMKDIDRYVNVGYQLDGLLEELGRGLQAAGTADVKVLTHGFRGFIGPFEMMKQHGSMNADSVAALVKEVGLERAAAVGKAVERSGLWDMVAEVTYGFTLSNPRTNLVNVASSSVLNPILTIMTRGIAETFGSGTVIPGEARAMLFGYINGVQRMMRAVAQTYSDGGALALMRSIRDVKPLEMAGGVSDKSGAGHGKAITGENVSALLPRPFQFDPAGWLGRIVDAAGSAIRTSSGLMELGDHFSYAVNYDMAMSARAFREGTKLGLEGEALQKFIDREMLKPTREIRREAEDFANHEIFKQLIDGRPGQLVEGLSHPALRPFITFVRTPVNIFRYNLEGVPVLNLALKGVRDDIAAGGARRDLALAKMTLGGTIAAIAGMVASNDVITGNGPENPKLRSLWLIDHQPYSIKLPGMDKWVSYRYMDPIASWFGMAADASHFMQFDKDELTSGEAAMAIALGFARNFTDKTYTRDTFDFLDQISVKAFENAHSSLESLERYLDRKATLYVPFSSLSRAVRNAVDPSVREAFTLMEKVQNSIPGWSKSLPEKLDFFGDPITNPRFNSFLPFPLKDNTGDDVVDEMIKVRANVGMPPKVLDGEDLTSQEYHDLVMARGKDLKKVIGMDLREAVIDVMNSEAYRGKDTTDGARALMIEKTVEAYNQAAIAYMATKDGELNPRFIKHLEAQKKAEKLTGQKLNMNFGAK